VLRHCFLIKPSHLFRTIPPRLTLSFAQRVYVFLAAFLGYFLQSFFFVGEISVILLSFSVILLFESKITEVILCNR